jgi:hypothetical protein
MVDSATNTSPSTATASAAYTVSIDIIKVCFIRALSVSLVNTRDMIIIIGF